MQSVATYGPTSPSRAGNRLRPEIRWGIGVGVAVAVLWEASARAVADLQFLIPPLSSVLRTGWDLSLSGYLWAQLGHTLNRVLVGLAAGFAGGVITGLLMAIVPILRWILEPIIAAVYPMPKIALLPLFLVAFGLGNTSKIVLVSMSTFFIVVITTAGALRHLDPIYRDALHNLGAGRRLVIRRLLLPGALPGIFTGLRLAAGVALLITLAVEFTSARDGIGWMMWMAWQTLALERLYIGLLICALLGLGLASGVRVLERHFVPWIGSSGRG